MTMFEEEFSNSVCSYWEKTSLSFPILFIVSSFMSGLSALRESLTAICCPLLPTCIVSIRKKM